MVKVVRGGWCEVDRKGVWFRGGRETCHVIGSDGPTDGPLRTLRTGAFLLRTAASSLILSTLRPYG